MAAVVYLDPARENLKTATVIVYAISLMTAVLMQMHCVLDQCSTVQYQVYTYMCIKGNTKLRCTLIL